MKTLSRNIRSGLRFVVPVVLLLSGACASQAQFTLVTNNNAITIIGYAGAAGDLIIPESINGLPVSGIGNHAFSGRSDVTSVTTIGGEISIGSAAFAACPNLTNVTILNGQVNIGGAAFYYCVNLKSIIITNCVAHIGDYAFEDALKLEVLALSSGVASIGDWAFAACQSLTSAAIPNTLTNIAAVHLIPAP